MTRKPKQNDLIVAALAAGRSNADAARSAGVSVSTVVRRLRDEAFVAAVRAERQRLLESASAGLIAASTRAVEALSGLLTDDSPSIRLQAAKCVLEQTTRMRDAVELAERIARLEQQIGGTKR